MKYVGDVFLQCSLTKAFCLKDMMETSILVASSAAAILGLVKHGINRNWIPQTRLRVSFFHSLAMSAAYLPYHTSSISRCSAWGGRAETCLSLSNGVADFWALRIPLHLMPRAT